MEICRRTMMMGAAAFAAMPGRLRAASAGGWYDRAIIIDGLGGIGDPYANEDTPRLTDRAWKEIRETGVSVVRDTIFPVGNTEDPWADYKKAIDEYRKLFAANPERLVTALSVADIVAAKRTGKLAIVMGTQDTSMVGPALDRLATMKKDGIRTVQLTYNNRNLSGDGSIEPDNAGLSKLGRATIERIEAEKLLLDLSHGGARTMAEAATHAKRPLVISHTGARAISDHPRNTSDQTMRAVADKGGVVGLYFMPYLTPITFKDSPGEDLLRHADHMLQTVGEDHVAIGTDNGPLPTEVTAERKKQLDAWQKQRIDEGIAAPGEGIGWYPWIESYNSIDRYRRFADDLIKRGWNQRQVEKMMGGNLLRVYGEAWGG